MAGSLNGLGPQVPLSNTFQPGSSAGQPRPDRTDSGQEDKSVNAKDRASGVRETDNGSGNSRTAEFQARRARGGEEETEKKKRGSLVDITV